MSTSINHSSPTIVVDIVDPNESHPAALDAARQFLREGSIVHLHHRAFHQKMADQTQDPEDDVLDQARDLVLKARRERLAELGNSITKADVFAHTAWCENHWQSLLAFTAKQQATMLIVQCGRPQRWRPLTPANVDWQLIRHCPVPLLIAGQGCQRPYRRIVAAVDPMHPGDKPAELDRRIVRHAFELAQVHRAPLSVINVVPPVSNVAGSAAGPLYLPKVVSKNLLDAHKAEVQSLFSNLDSTDIETHVVTGNPAQEIIQYADDTSADLVVMGAVSRSGLRNFLIGNTAEKVLDRLRADTLIVKPRPAAQNRGRTSHSATGERDRPDPSDTAQLFARI